MIAIADQCSMLTLPMLCSSQDGNGYLDMFAKVWQHGEGVAPRLSNALDVTAEPGLFELGLRKQDGTRAFKATFWGEGLHWLDLTRVGLRFISNTCASSAMWHWEQTFCCCMH